MSVLGGSWISKEPPVQILLNISKSKNHWFRLFQNPPTIDGFHERMGSLAGALTF
jgi:hypothetical protein